MKIIEKSLQGDTAWLNKLLDKDPTQINSQQKFTILGNKEVTLTPLFAAAVAGYPGLVKNLMERGAPLSTGGEEDLFTWTCLCSDRKAREIVLDYLMEGELLQRIHPGLERAHGMIAKGKRAGKLPESSEYPLNFVQTALLSSTLCECVLISEFLHFFNRPIFRGMTLLELKTYRVAISQMLKVQGHAIKPDPDLELYEAAAIGDLEALKGYPIGNFLTRVKKGRFALDLRVIDIAARCGQIGVFGYLKNECGLDLLNLRKKDNEVGGKSVDFFAAWHGHVPLLKYFRDECGFDFNSCMEKGRLTGLRLTNVAVESGQVEVLRYLRDECKIDLKSPLVSGHNSGWRLIDQAAHFGRVDVLKYLRDECGLDLWFPKYTQKKILQPLSLGAKYPKVLEFFGIDAQFHEFVHQYLLPKLPISIMHLTCLAANKHGVEELVKAGFSAINKIRGPSGVLEPYEFVFTAFSSKSGPPMLHKRKQQVETLRYLLNSTDAGEDGVGKRFERLRKEAPHLYWELVSGDEQMIDELLAERKDFLAKKEIKKRAS